MTSDAVANQYYTQETEDRTEAERKRDHTNALRRASYRRKKLPNVLDGNAKTLVVTGKVQNVFNITVGIVYTNYHNFLWSNPVHQTTQPAWSRFQVQIRCQL